MLQSSCNLLFRKSKDIGRTKAVVPWINTGNAKPYVQPHSRVPVLSEALNFMMRDILARNTVTLSKSHWCASIFFMRKKNQSLWLRVKFSSVIEVKNRWYFRCVGLFKLVLSILFCIYLFLSWCISSIHHTIGSIWVTHSAICVLLSNAHCIQYQTGWLYTFVSVISILQCM